jgi:hypothetical protein
MFVMRAVPEKRWWRVLIESLETFGLVETS